MSMTVPLGSHDVALLLAHLIQVVFRVVAAIFLLNGLSNPNFLL